MELKGRGFDFFIGIAVGLMGNFLASYTVEFSKAVFEKLYGSSSSVVLWYWASMFIGASVLFFQFLRIALKIYDLGSRMVVYILHLGTVGCIVIGIIAIVLDIL